jgi:hypothetical protein
VFSAASLQPITASMSQLLDRMINWFERVSDEIRLTLEPVRD